MQVIETEPHSCQQRQERSINLKILNGEHFIVSADAETMKTILFCYSPSRDAIVINEKAPCIDKTVELMAFYLELDDLEKKEVIEYAKHEKDKAIQNYFAFLNGVARIRRRLYKSMKH